MKDNKTKKTFYICGPLTELPAEQREGVKALYEKLADVCRQVAGIRAFVPHEHYDLMKHANFTPQEVDAAERQQVCEHTSCLIVVPVAASWGGGIEVEMANCSNVPVIILCERKKLEQKKISRLLRGNPAVAAIIIYHYPAEALDKLKEELYKIKTA